MVPNMKGHRVWKLALTAASFSVVLLSLATSSQPTSSSLGLDQDTVVVCLYNFCNPDEIAHVASLPRFETFEEAKQALEPRGGGTILLAPGVFRVTEEWQGNWTLKGLGIPEAIVFLPKDKLPVTFETNEAIADFFPFAAQVSMFKVKQNSSLKLENVTLQDDYTAPTVSPDNPSVDRERFALASYAVSTEENSSLSLNNVRVLNWNYRAFYITPKSNVAIQNSELIAPAESITSFLSFQATVNLSNNILNHFYLLASSEVTIEGNDFYKSGLAIGDKASVKNNRFLDVHMAGRFQGYESDFRFAADVAGNAEIVGNTFEVRDPALQDFIARGYEAEALLLRTAPDDLIVVRDNTFRGYSAGISTYFGVDHLELENNLFDGNQVGLAIGRAAAPTKIAAKGNRFVNHPRCAVAVDEKANLNEIAITGLDNEFQGNAQNICPPDFPLPEGFSKR